MKPEAIILAAGFSSRMGTFKPALDLGGKTLIERCLEPMYEHCSRIFVIGGYKFEVIQEILAVYPKVELIYNPDYPAGMFTSVKLGLRKITAPRFFLTPGDYPLVTSDTYKALLAADGNIVVPSFAGRSGHPILLKKELIPPILENHHLNALRDYIYQNERQIVTVADPGIHQDVDNSDDYCQAAKHFENPSRKVINDDTYL